MNCFCDVCCDLFFRQPEYVWREFCNLWVRIGDDMRARQWLNSKAA